MIVSKEIIVSDSYLELMFDKIGSNHSYSINNGELNIQLGGEGDGYAYFPSYAQFGSFVVVECEAKQNTEASEGRFGITFRADSSIGGSPSSRITPDSMEWKRYKISFPVPLDRPYFYVYFGGTGAIGDISFRNIKIQVYNGGLVYPSIRSAVVTGIDGVWKIHDEMSGFSNYLVKSVSLTDTNLSVLVEWEPLGGHRRPIVIASMSRFGFGAGKSVFFENITNNSCEFAIYDSDGNRLNLANFTGQMSFAFEVKSFG